MSSAGIENSGVDLEMSPPSTPAFHNFEAPGGVGPLQ